MLRILWVGFVYLGLIVFALLTVVRLVKLGLWLRRRAVGLRCPGCNYSLEGNTAGVCPECGEAVQSPSVGRASLHAVLSSCIAFVLFVFWCIYCLFPASTFRTRACMAALGYPGSYSLNTFAHFISCCGIKATYEDCQYRISGIVQQPPEVYCYWDQLGYEGLAEIWQLEDRYILMTVFAGNDSNIIRIESTDGLFDAKQIGHQRRECTICDLDRIDLRCP